MINQEILIFQLLSQDAKNNVTNAAIYELQLDTYKNNTHNSKTKKPELNLI